MKKHIAIVAAFMLCGALTVGAQNAQTTTKAKPTNVSTLPQKSISTSTSTTTTTAPARKTVTPQKVTVRKAVPQKAKTNSPQ